MLQPYVTAICQGRPETFQHTVGLSGKVSNDDNEIAQDYNSDAATFEDEEEEEENDEEEQANDVDDRDDDINELEELGEDEKNRVLEETAIIRKTITKVSNSNLKQKAFVFSLLTILLI
jgi:TATA-binding protein-associated factor Taf7